ncbi:hypothetical protein [Rhodoferax sp.]|uniref:hypothetical protein n=1 Tax=Rhodoferax sp. TaxID=50421 RepID=UPI00261B821D|nr:hypothetical protein [Rhodoferax sp.]MDD5481021.1 hypothetical protein [Rhodoferax sp.]
MNHHLKAFVLKYLSVVFATLMSVSFFAFLAIPYGLGGHPGEETSAQNSAPVVQMAAVSQATTTPKIKS